MTGVMIAYCGMICTDCEAYKATRAGDTAKLKELALDWYKKEDDNEIAVCFGCLSDSRNTEYCSRCGIRACAFARGVETCAHCDDYGCEKMEEVCEIFGHIRERLEEIRASI